MAEPQISAPTRARGVVHVRVRHTDRFTVVGHHLAQHGELTLAAIGLAVHIQSLPEGARVDIKTLAARFPEGETRIASALRELEAHGYLSRTRERLPSRRVVTRTVAYDRPGARPEAAPVPPVQREPRRVPEPVPEPAPEPEPAAASLLTDLGRLDDRLRLSERDVRRLAPAVTEWLARGVDADAVRRALTSGLPPTPRHPAGLLAHRLAALPPPRPPAPPPRDPLQNCDGCERAYRAPAPGGRCGDCRSSSREPRAA
ncbi:helix-turn-helix domain-containing protein [Streptomyces sp. NBC_01198]|uniref:helix-turn-helix domain-containing protein n=1 Tax=Streptomyces sp. NBC_01198 TaxID=2903769 RepID=UPI002E11F438|nr:helix-turn-helix domain-containing protein [Streptomyces sp. NBC_01198]